MIPLVTASEQGPAQTVNPSFGANLSTELSLNYSMNAFNLSK
ncbi:hypothetical protein PFNF54_01284, partial [Plasmodium falciparum NF54]